MRGLFSYLAFRIFLDYALILIIVTNRESVRLWLSFGFSPKFPNIDSIYDDFFRGNWWSSRISF
jgi:hypothetical protein